MTLDRFGYIILPIEYADGEAAQKYKEKTVLELPRDMFRGTEQLKEKTLLIEYSLAIVSKKFFPIFR